MRRRGLEPPRAIKPTRPSTLRVYQFRHRRVRGAEYSRVAPEGTGRVGALESVGGLRYRSEHMFVCGIDIAVGINFQGGQ